MCALEHIGATFKGTFLAKFEENAWKISKCAPFSSEFLATLTIGEMV